MMINLPVLKNFFPPQQQLSALVACVVVFAAPRMANAAFEVTVAGDGSGNFKTVQAAVDSAPDNGTNQFIIRIKPGTYREKLVVPSAKRLLAFVGEDAER